MANRLNFRAYVLLLILIGIAVLSGCEKISRSDPFHGRIPEEYRNLNAKNLERLRYRNPSNFMLIRIALISDSHYDYDRLAKAIKSINKLDYDLVVHLGDLTQSGTFDEYLHAVSLLSDLEAPFFCVPGNHDYLASGQSLFQEFFGNPNFVVQDYYGAVPLIFWDNTVWERSSGTPDTKWLSDVVLAASSRLVVFCHQPPWSDQMADTYGNFYSGLLSQTFRVTSVHGHEHEPSDGFIYKGHVPYAICGSTMNNVFSELIIDPEGDRFCRTIAF